MVSNVNNAKNKIHLFANHILTKKYHHDNDENVNRLRNVIGILQHHDAVTGTAKQHVTNDYAWHLYNATKSLNVNNNIDNNSLNKYQFILKDLRNTSKSQQSLPYQLNLIHQRTIQIPERQSSIHRLNYEVLFNPKNILAVGKDKHCISYE
ncbi:unnamed protein product [Schistosoma curassoni]|nr:unnamed protein product [Schistosoma curassoni]